MLRSLLTFTLGGVLLTVLFWPRLWQGGGFIGGDIYTYFLPQKAFLADRLHAGELPFWNNITGHGYPLIGESQTGVLYPVNWLLYRCLDLNRAYVVSHLLHYVLAFVGMGFLAKRLGLNIWGTLLAGVVYVYGWFPPRACLEWAIIGGVYLPATLWCLESWFQSRRIRYGAGLACLLALDLLAGHFNLAFITTLALAVYALLRVAWREGDADHSTDCSRTGSPIDVALGEGRPILTAHTRWRWLLWPLLFVAIAYGLAAPQLAPSWSLKRASQRTEANDEFDPGYGHIPPWYLTQVALPWLWYGAGADPDQVLNTLKLATIPSLTNKVEAHLYFGWLPLGLTVVGLLRWLWTRAPLDRRLIILGGLGVFGMIYATGWLLPLARYLPGFGYFRGPGRWGLLTTLAVALLAGQVLSRWTAQRGFRWRSLLAVGIIGLTILDLHWMRHQQWYTFEVSDPPVAHRQESEVARQLKQFQQQHGPPRMLAPGPNLAALAGYAVTPPYLGFGPDAYYLAGGRLPDVRLLQFLSGDQTPKNIDVAIQFDWLRQAGVTHILSMKPLPANFPVHLVWSGFDRLLNPAWARWSPDEPLLLYSIDGAPGRLFVDSPASQAVAELVEYSANRVVATIDTPQPATVVLADLPWPEWEATIDGQPAAVTDQIDASPSAFDGTSDASPVQRRVSVTAGRHQIVWRYRPRSLWTGLWISIASLLLLILVVTWYHRRHDAARELSCS
ncbi:MAG: hypothetical protein ACK5Q5_04070 [Planctomycetaceae bacterium]